MLRKLMYSGYAFVATTFTTALVFAESTGGGAEGNAKVALAIAAGFGISLAAFGGALGQGRAAASALEGIARNPGAADKIFVPMIIGLALIESLVIYALVISFMLLGKL